MADLGLLLTDDLALAAFEGRKTETRRPLRPQDPRPEWHRVSGDFWNLTLRWPSGKVERQSGITATEDRDAVLARYLGPVVIAGAGTAKVGGRLWVREAWALATGHPGDPMVAVRYRSDGSIAPCSAPGATEKYSPMRSMSERWRPSVHMPKWAARTWGRIESVRAERLDAITEAGAVREGFAADERLRTTARQNFLAAWCRLYGEFAGDFALINNPFVWVVSWTPMPKPEFSNV